VTAWLSALEAVRTGESYVKVFNRVPTTAEIVTTLDTMPTPGIIAHRNDDEESQAVLKQRLNPTFAVADGCEV
jgi:hypothetical protein